MDFERDVSEVNAETAHAREIIIPPGTIRKRLKSTTVEKVEKLVVKKKVPFSLTALLQNNVKCATFEKPIDPNSLEGQRDLLAKRDREQKLLAKNECLDKFSSVDSPLANWAVSFFFFF